MEIRFARRHKRLFAVIIDYAIFVLSISTGVILSLRSIGAHSSINFLIFFIPMIIIIALQINLLYKHGQTIGKVAQKIIVVDGETFVQAGFKQIFLNRILLVGLFKMIPFMPLVDALMIFRKDRKCLHDRVANTIVIDLV